jgi:hypothetical protein
MSGADRSNIHARCNLFMEEVSSAVSPWDGKSKSMSIVKQRMKFEMNASRNEDHRSVTFEIQASQLHSPISTAEQLQNRLLISYKS